MAETNRRKPRRDAALSKDEIAREALALIDEDGLDGFSFRKLARRLGCEAMSIYYYFPSKSHLFDSLVDICIDETPNPDSDLPPRERLREFCLRIRETALRHPGFARFWLTHRLNHHHALGWLNRGVGVFEEAGLPTETAARVFRNVSYWVMGAALDETAGYSRGPSAAEPVPFDVAARDFPAIIRLGAYFGPENHDKTYLFGLEMLLDWFEAEVAAASARRKTA